MTRLEFGNQAHIDYAKAKANQSCKAWQQHSCDCEDCDREEYTCPYCKSNKEPDWDEDNFFKCVDCGGTGEVIGEKMNADGRLERSEIVPCNCKHL